MATSSSQPDPGRSISREEEARASGSTTDELTPLLASQQTKVDHRFLGVSIPLWLPRRYIAVFLAFMGTLTVVLVSAVFIDPIWKWRQSVFMNNGTHDFRKTVIVISFDGFRADYLQRGLTPHLLATGENGLRARWLQPCYPAATYPNHWSIITGLYPESHGIIANEFIDPETDAHFFYKNTSESWNASWWGGEPMWETAVKAGLKAGNLMWPGPPVTRNGNKPTYFVPFRKDNITLQGKADQILEWIDMPFDDRPQLITMYDSLPNDMGHWHGPDSPEMNDTIMDIDAFAHAVRNGLSQRNLSSIVNVIFLSDHGMAPIHERKLIYLDNILGEEGIDEIAWKLSRPSAGLWFKPGTNVTRHLERLHKAAARPPYNFKVYTATNNVWEGVYNGASIPVDIPPSLQNPFPSRKHFSPDHNSRIPPIYVVPDLGWVVAMRREAPRYVKGDHGYDNEDPFMRAMFIASGPFTDRVRAQAFAEYASHSSASPIPSPARSLRTLPATHLNTTTKPLIYVPPKGRHGGGGPVLIEHFENVEVYGLVMRMLGIQSWTAAGNGTEGFWDAWFDRE